MMDFFHGLPWLQWWAVALTIVVPGLYTLARGLFVLIVRDFARRFFLTFLGIWLFDRTVGRLTRHAIWSGQWKITWQVKSKNFQSTNSWEGRIYRCFDTIAATGAGHVTDGTVVPYGFIGKLTRGETILTGTWFDTRGSQLGYHGAFQVRLTELGTTADGKWVGFSGQKQLVRAGRLLWERIADD